jgi:hypothetical protein
VAHWALLPAQIKPVLSGFQIERDSLIKPASATLGRFLLMLSKLRATYFMTLK